jgi:hypothetical protein
LDIFKNDELSVNMTLATLLAMGVNRADLTEDVLSELPPWSQVLINFGSEPVILGLERCQAFRDAAPPRDRQIAPAGLFSSGTTVLQDLLFNSCRPPFEGIERAKSIQYLPITLGQTQSRSSPPTSHCIEDAGSEPVGGPSHCRRPTPHYLEGCAVPASV